MVRLADLLRAAGAAHSPGGQDTELVHVNKREKAMLKAMGGAGVRNPVTGLKQYYDGDTGDGSEGSASAASEGATDGGGHDPGSDTSAAGSYAEWAGRDDYQGEPQGATPGVDANGVPLDAYEMNPDVSVPGAPSQQAIGNYLNNPEAWNDQFGNVMSGLPEGMASDFADWMSRNGWYSQPGAGQVGAFDFLGNILGDRHDLQANPLQTWITQNHLQGLFNYGPAVLGGLLGVPGLGLAFNALRGENILGQGLNTLANVFGGPQAGLATSTINNLMNDRPGNALTGLIGSQVPGFGAVSNLTGLSGALNNAINSNTGTVSSYGTEGDSGGYADAASTGSASNPTSGLASAWGIGSPSMGSSSYGSNFGSQVPSNSEMSAPSYLNPFTPELSNSSYSRPRRLGDIFRG